MQREISLMIGAMAKYLVDLMGRALVHVALLEAKRGCETVWPSRRLSIHAPGDLELSRLERMA